MNSVFGAEFRRVENREYLGKPAVVAVATRSYDTTVDDLWDAITTRERLARWFAPVEGDLAFGGRYQIQGNAGGSITRCEPPEAFDLTWEFAGGMSWLEVRLMPAGGKARLTLEHIAHRGGIGEEHLKKFGPSAVGVGWDSLAPRPRTARRRPGQGDGPRRARGLVAVRRGEGVRPRERRGLGRRGCRIG